MKRTILFVVTAFIAFGTVFRAEAKKPEDQEFRRVIVTLKSGEKVEGVPQKRLARRWRSSEKRELFVQNHQNAR